MSSGCAGFGSSWQIKGNECEAGFFRLLWILKGVQRPNPRSGISRRKYLGIKRDPVKVSAIGSPSMILATRLGRYYKSVLLISKRSATLPVDMYVLYIPTF